MIIKFLLIIFSTLHFVHSLENGVCAKPKNCNYVVSIRLSGHHYCTGTIIDERHIITVGHTVIDIPKTSLRVVAGCIVIYRSRSKISVQEIYFHPGFKKHKVRELPNDEYYDNDIALLRLNEKLIWTPSVAPISLVDMEYDFDECLRCIIVSWHTSQRETSQQSTLMWKFIRFVNRGVGPQWHVYILKNQEFFNVLSGTAAIDSDDLGSPIVCGGFMVGLVVKGGHREIPEIPSTMQSIFPYLGFVTEIIQDGLFEVPPREFRYVASVWYHGAYACGGFIVDATHIATVGHCVANHRSPDFQVAVGYPSGPQSLHTVQYLSVNNIVLHPEYKMHHSHLPPMWSAEHDLAILTLANPIMWSPTIVQVPMIGSNYSFTGRVCRVLRWMREINETTGEELITLKSSRAKLLNNLCTDRMDPIAQSETPIFWGISSFSMPIADSKDVGNPVICEDNPIGFLVQAYPMNGEMPAKAAKFLRIYPYKEFINNVTSAMSQ